MKDMADSLRERKKAKNEKPDSPTNHDKLVSGLKRLLPDKDFQRFVKYLGESLYYRRPVLGADPNTLEINNTTVYMATRQTVYLELQQLFLQADPKALNEIEKHEIKETKDAR